MIVPPNVRTQRRLLLPERGGEGRQYARVLLHLLCHHRGVVLLAHADLHGAGSQQQLWSDD